MLRQHQFDKVELVSITTPEKSLEEHERMTTCAEEVLRQLDLAYRVMVLSTGDMGFASRRRPTTWKSGCRAKRRFAKSPPARSAAISRRGACRRAIAPKDEKQPQLRPHAERLRRRGRPRADRGDGDLSERGRLDHRAGRARAPTWAAWRRSGGERDPPTLSSLARVVRICAGEGHDVPRIHRTPALIRIGAASSQLDALSSVRERVPDGASRIRDDTQSRASLGCAGAHAP